MAGFDRALVAGTVEEKRAEALHPASGAAAERGAYAEAGPVIRGGTRMRPNMERF